MPAKQPSLPEGWYYPTADAAAGVHAELQRELPPDHLLFGCELEVFAVREATDDMLVRHCADPQRFTAVHLTWIGRTEIDAAHPTVEFDGTFADFLANEERLYGLTPPGRPEERA